MRRRPMKKWRSLCRLFADEAGTPRRPLSVRDDNEVAAREHTKPSTRDTFQSLSERSARSRRAPSD
jgi:hypothetical protein